MSTAVWMVMCSEPMIRAPAERLGVGELGAGGHQAGHLVLGQLDLLAAEAGEGEVGDLEVVRGEGHVWSPPRVNGDARSATQARWAAR